MAVCLVSSELSAVTMMILVEGCFSFISFNRSSPFPVARCMSKNRISGIAHGSNRDAHLGGQRLLRDALTLAQGLYLCSYIHHTIPPFQCFAYFPSAHMPGGRYPGICCLRDALYRYSYSLKNAGKNTMAHFSKKFSCQEKRRKGNAAKEGKITGW